MNCKERFGFQERTGFLYGHGCDKGLESKDKAKARVRVEGFKPWRYDYES